MKRIVWVGLLVLVSFAVGAAAVLLFVRLRTDTALSLLGIQQPVKPVTTQQASLSTISPETALDMSFGTLIDTIRSQKGFGLDHYSLSYLIIANQEIAGLSRTIAKSEANEAIRTAADSQLAESEENATKLILLQKQLGHSHH